MVYQKEKIETLETQQEICNEDECFRSLQSIVDNEVLDLKGIDLQKNVAKNVIDFIEKEFKTNAIIAGGAPRNWSLKRKANDLDIYFKAKGLNGTISSRNIVEALRKAGFLDEERKLNLKGEVRSEERYYKSGIRTIESITVAGQKVQLIGMRSDWIAKTNFAKQVFDTFDFGINKIAWGVNAQNHSGLDGNRYYADGDFGKDIDNKTFTLRERTLAQKHNFAYRYKKMKKYFPEHELVIEK